MELRNLTPHAITMIGVDGAETTLPPSGTVARVAQTPGAPHAVEGVPVTVLGAPTWGEVTNLPDPEASVLLIVSGMVAARVPHRRDVVSPDTGPTARREAGQVTGVRALVCAAEEPAREACLAHARQMTIALAREREAATWLTATEADAFATPWREHDALVAAEREHHRATLAAATAERERLEHEALRCDGLDAHLAHAREVEAAAAAEFEEAEGEVTSSPVLDPAGVCGYCGGAGSCSQCGR